MKNKSRLLIIAAVTLVLLVAAGGLAYKKRNNRPASTPAPTTTDTSQEKIDYSPATEADQQRANQQKEDFSKKEEDAKPASSVTPVIISASATGVKGFVPGLYESGGTCEAVFTKGDKKVTKQSAASKGATTTDCAPIGLTRADFPEAGDWSLTLSYRSATASGTSTAKKVTVQ